MTVNGLGTTTVAVIGNTIRQWTNPYGMEFKIGDTSPTLNATVTGNTLKEPNLVPVGASILPLEGVKLDAGLANLNAPSVCFDFGGAGVLRNDIVGSGYAAGSTGDFRIRQRFNSTVRLPGYGGAATDTAAVISYIQGRNNAPTGSATASSPPGGGFIGGAACTQPTLPAAAIAAGNTNTAPEQKAAPITSAPASADVVGQASTQQATIGTASRAADPAPTEKPMGAAVQPQAPKADTVNLIIGTLPAGKSITVIFDAVIANPVPPSATQVSNQGTVSGSNFSSVLTNDPDTPAADDPTVTPLNLTDTKRCGMSLNTPYSFNTGAPVVVTFTQFGDLSCLQVARTDSNPPNGTAAIQTGRYWQITATNSDGTEATGYQATLVLPQNNLGDPKVCKYPGNLGGFGWDCARDSFDATTVTRSGITEFSEWAVGNTAGPTTVSLNELSAKTTAASSAPWLIALLALVLGGLGVRRRLRRL